MSQVSDQAIFAIPVKNHAQTAAPWIVTCLLLVGPVPMLLKLSRFLWEREQYQFFPLMIMGAGLLAWERWQDLPDKIQSEAGSRGVVVGLFATAMILLAGSALIWVQALAGLSTIFTLAAIAWRFGGRRLVRVIGPSLVLLLTILPPPGGRDQRVTLKLQQIAVSVSSRMLDMLHVPHVQSGNVLEIPGRRLLVEQACSGINSLMAVLAFSLLYGFWKQRPIWRIILLLPAAGFFVLWGNITRITAEAWLKVVCNIDWLEGTKHQLMGLGLFVACVGLVISFDALIGVVEDLLGWRADMGDRQILSGLPGKKYIDRQRVSWPDWVMAAICAAMGVWMQARVWNAWTPPSIQKNAKFDLPETLAGWQKINKAALLVERPQTDAATSYIWQYHRGDLIASVAIDYPFTGYHELSYCYATSGWNLLPETSLGELRDSIQSLEMTKVPNANGYLLFNLTDEKGQVLPYRPSFSGSSLRDRADTYRSIALGGPTYQVQVLAQQNSELTPDQQAETQKLFIEARRTLVSQVQSQLNKP